MIYLGDIAAASTLYFKFHTVSSTGAPITLAGTPAVKVYKDGGTTEDADGVTLSVDFDSVTGMHSVAIDTSADATFYSAGSDFSVVLTAGTVDGISVVGTVLREFSIENRTETDVSSLATGSNLETLDGKVVTIDGIVDAILEDTGTTLPATLSGLATSAALATHDGKLDTVDGIVDAILVDTGTTLPATLAAFNDLSAAEVNAEVDTALAEYDGPTKAEMDAGHAGISAPTAAAIADAVWIEALADHSGTAGSTAEALNAAGAAGDPWSVELPGSYTGNKAGNLIGSKLARESTLLGELATGVLVAKLTATGDDTALEIRRGDVVTFTFSIGYDLTGKKVQFTAKNDPEDTNAEAIISGACTITDAAAGTATYTTTAAETASTGNLYYDVEVRETDDSAPSTAIFGRMRILSDVYQ